LQLVDLLDRGADGLPELARQTLLLIADMISGLSQQIRKIESELMKWHRANAVCQRLETIPGIGFITATALAASVNDARTFCSGRQFSAWLGLVPKQHSSGGPPNMIPALATRMSRRPKSATTRRTTSCIAVASPASAA
jgi:transposase